MSMSAALCYRPDRSAAELVFATQPGAYNTETLIDFLRQLHAHFGQDAKGGYRTLMILAVQPPAGARSPCSGTDCPATAAAT